MKPILISFTALTILFLASCKQGKDQFIFEAQSVSIPSNVLLDIENRLIHRGVFSNDLQDFYYTVSDTNFQRFDIWHTRLANGNWSVPRLAPFNSDFSDHGMSFSPDGNTIYFSSTRPTTNTSGMNKWKLWQSRLINDSWSIPKPLSIPNLKNKLLSHPSVDHLGNIYFHSSNQDYSNMHIYSAKKSGVGYEPAIKIDFEDFQLQNTCTPYISNDGQLLFFAAIDNQDLILYASQRSAEDLWTTPKKLEESELYKGKGNPYLSPDHSFVLYTRSIGNTWHINKVSTSDLLNHNEH